MEHDTFIETYRSGFDLEDEKVLPGNPGEEKDYWTFC